jgi:hypothetical protein
VPNSPEIKNIILKNCIMCIMLGTIGYQKIVAVIRKQYYWSDMKKEVVDFIARCLECQKVKAEHKHPTHLLHHFPILEWKWEVIKMDFITKLPTTAKQHDSIIVVVDKLTKASHFVPVKSTYKATNIIDIYMREIDKLHGVPKTIVSDRDPKFTSNFWKGLFKEIETSMNFSTTYHLESDGQTERVNQVIEDMLRMYVMDKTQKWEDYLYLVEFTYNNGYQSSLKMSPFKALYGRRCNIHVSRDNPAGCAVVGKELLYEMEEMMVKIRKNTKAFQDRQKSYANKGQTFREFKVGDHVFLKVKERHKLPEVGEFL